MHSKRELHKNFEVVRGLVKEKTCCFTGHRRLSLKDIKKIAKWLNEETSRLISQGVTDFICGGGLGFDQIAASLIIEKKQQCANVQLIFALPYRNQYKKWTERQCI
jgi:uncharacterized phage-like protein YoqJ